MATTDSWGKPYRIQAPAYLPREEKIARTQFVQQTSTRVLAETAGSEDPVTEVFKERFVAKYNQLALPA